MAKWFLRSKGEQLVGTLVDATIYAWDGDQNILIRPDLACERLLINRKDAKNANGLIECEIEILDAHEDAYLAAVKSFLNQVVTAVGVWVDDDGHDSKTELHPLDALWGRLAQPHWPDWAIRLKDTLVERIQQRLLDGVIPAMTAEMGEVFVHRLVAGSDDSFSLHPPLSDETRPVAVSRSFPPRPSGNWLPRWQPKFAVRQAIDFVDVVAPTDHGAALVLKLTPKSYKDGGPAVLIADVATFWTPPEMVGPGGISIA